MPLSLILQVIQPKVCITLLLYLCLCKYKRDILFFNIVGPFAEAGIRLPALLQGLESAHRSYGSLPWRDLVEPSVKLAREGFVVSKDFVDEVSRNTDYATLYGPLNPGDILKLRELASTLNIVAEYGARGMAFTSFFYRE